MNLKSPHSKQNRAVALVITLLFLSIITFLAIAFLAMTSRDKSAVNASLDVSTARSMSESALARAQAEVIAKMMASGDILNYDYMASQTYRTNGPFNTGELGVYDPINVNYDSFFTNPGAYNADAWAQNINNLFYDPRAPVFVTTNGFGSNDFRFWVDINRNGRFETNGQVFTQDPSGNWLGTMSQVNGEPEWIGVLKYPETNHSVINPFIGRYAFMVLPIGKTLDLNYIHNNSKFAAIPGNDTSPSPGMQLDGYIRDEGVGSWELNLAAYINEISPLFQTNTNPNYLSYPYTYYPSVTSISPMGGVNYDASQFVGFRYGFNPFYPETMYNAFGNPVSSVLSNIDEYGTSPSIIYPYDYAGTPMTVYPWPGTYSSNMFYDVQDLFDSSKTGTNFPRNLAYAVGQIDTTNRYTFQRLIDSIGMGSSPEYGVYVYSNFFTTNPAVVAIPSQTLLRTKVNINYDNTAQIQAGPYTPSGSYTPMPTNLVSWSPIGFFTNAAELLLRSQVFIFTNYAGNGLGQYLPVPPGQADSFIYTSFGLTNIPVYNATNPGIVYNEQVHRMLQLAANIYAAANPVNISGVPQPPVFRPIFRLINGGTPNAVLDIIGYTNVTAATAYQQMFYGIWQDPTNALTSANAIGPNDNVWGVPWIVGAVKGIPQFDQCNYQTRVFMQRKLQFIRYPDPNHTGQFLTSSPQYTNQYYEMAVSNTFGIDAWNPYTNNFFGSSGRLVVVASNYITVTITNNYRFRFVTNIPQSIVGSNLFLTGPNYWAGGLNPAAYMFKTFLQTNFVSLPLSIFSEKSNAFILADPTQTYPSFDTNQTAWATHDWVVTVTNHLYYALFDGLANQGNVLDFVNLGPFGYSFDITSNLVNSKDPQWFGAEPHNWWTYAPGTDGAPVAQIPTGVANQIQDCSIGNGQFGNSMAGRAGGLPPTTGMFGPPFAFQGPQFIGPYVYLQDSNIWTASDPLVHYTLGDLNYPGYTQTPPQLISAYPSVNPPWSTSLGAPTPRYTTGAANGNITIVNGSMTGGNIVFGDPGIRSPNDWQFPTNLFPSVGWLGRVHRGTPWQTVYLKPDDPNPSASYGNWSTRWVVSPFTYPTNDWSLVDLFTAVPNDNAARGLLSVNQTNGSAWAAVFGGVIALTNSSTVPAQPVGEPIWPAIDPPPVSPTAQNGFPTNVYYLMDYTNGAVVGINQARMNLAYNPNGLFHKIGDILQAPTLTVNNAFILNAGSLNDEMVERIPQQTLSLLKLGMPQFVIYAWGQSLKPKSLYSGNNPNLVDLCTNYEITGEYMTRTVCHVVSPDGTTTAPKIVVDSFNIEPGN